MISQTAEYALRAIVFLADHPDQAHTAEAIAQGTRVPVGYLAKIMQMLAKNGLVSSQRGLYGGFTLRRSPAELTVYDVIHCIDPINRINRCPVDLESHGVGLCHLHKVLDDAMGMVETSFRGFTIKQLLTLDQDSRPLCEFKRRLKDGPAAAPVAAGRRS